MQLDGFSSEKGIYVAPKTPEPKTRHTDMRANFGPGVIIQFLN